jgi:hypothetical protein
LASSGRGEEFREGKVIRLELDPNIRGDLAVVQVPWYVFNRIDALLGQKGIVVIMGQTSDYLVVASNPARLYEVAGMLHEVLHYLHLYRSAEPDLG